MDGRGGHAICYVAVGAMLWKSPCLNKCGIPVFLHPCNIFPRCSSMFSLTSSFAGPTTYTYIQRRHLALFRLQHTDNLHLPFF